MIRLGCVIALVAMAASAAALADGALVVGSTADVAKDGVAIGTSVNYKTREAAEQAALEHCRAYKSAPKAAAQCRPAGTFKGECYALALDPQEGTPGAGWAIATTKALAEQRAIAQCQITAGEGRRDFCRLAESKCDED
jgi:hypothetical protein